jgi:hypothetical protein
MANTSSPMKLSTSSSVAPPHSSAQGSGGCGGSMSNQRVGGETIPPALPLPMKTTPTRPRQKAFTYQNAYQKNKILPKRLKPKSAHTPFPTKT